MTVVVALAETGREVIVSVYDLRVSKARRRRRRRRISNFGGLLVIGIFGGRWIEGVGEGEGWEKGGKGEREKGEGRRGIGLMDGWDGVCMHSVYRLTGLGPITVVLGFTPQHLHALP